MAPLSKDGRQTTRIVLTAIRNLRGDGGSTLKHIQDYIKSRFPIKNRFNLKRTIERALEFGAVEKYRNRYSLGSVLKHIVQGKRRGKGRTRRRRRRRRH